MSPKSPVGFVQFHQHHQLEHPPLAIDYGFHCTRLLSRKRKGRDFRSLDFEVGIRENASSSYPEAPPYHQYLKEDQWEGHGSGEQREREQLKAGIGTDPGTMYEDGPYFQMQVFDARLSLCGVMYLFKFLHSLLVFSL